MQTRHPLRAALVAASVPLVVIAVFGNAWFTEQVRFDGRRGPLGTRLLATLAPFPWTFTPRTGRGAGTLWLAQGFGVVVVVGGVFLVTWAIARHATGASLVLGVWGATVLVAMTAAFLTSLVAYGVIFADARVDGLGRFWHSVYEGQEVVLWGVLVGLPAGVLAALLVGGVDRRPGYVMSSTLTTTDPMWTAQLATPAPVQVVTVAPAPSGQLAYVTAPVITGVAAAPVVAAPVPLVPPPTVPVSEPTVVMVQRGPAPPPSPTVSAPPDSTEN